ncbi:hypothetical protein OGM63_13415 [Plectonema radiosum NIES-515]|uniref:DUF4253 domain-containing protein n=1 Tax=Plectonema radiosum NIES-515 TaxID=2986073 RepID=A0ABT3AZE3_9CYAN|nr:hypothetical protein [Plectonema radiosum]MCV3214498.1 hypothetical protein [Plectonema radiosum NIES-515]
MNNLNQDYHRRDEIVFGQRINWDEDFGGAERFQNLSLEQLEKLLEEGFANPQEKQNFSPTIEQFYEFGKNCVAKGYNLVFIGYAISPDREDYRTSIEGIEVRVETELIESRIDANLRDEFEKFAQSADETEINFSVLYAWWD